MNSHVRGIILAAGKGSRMLDFTAERPKCRLEVKNKELIEWQLDALRLGGVTDIAIVRGYLGHTFDLNLHYFENQKYNQTNMVRSLMEANRWLQKSKCIVSYSDIIYHHSAILSLVNHPGDIVITFDPDWHLLWNRRFSNPLEDAESFVENEGVLLDIGNKANHISEIKGQYMGLMSFTPQGWRKALGVINKLSTSAIDKLDITSMFQLLLLEKVTINCVTYGNKWYEIDSPTDLSDANSQDKLFF